MPHRSLFPPLRSDLFTDCTNYLHEFSPLLGFGCDNKLQVAGTRPELPCPWVDSAGLHVDPLLKVSPTDFHCQSDDKRDDSTTMVAVKQN